MKPLDSYNVYIFDFDMTLFDTSFASAICYKAAFDLAHGEFHEELLLIYMSEFLEDTYARIIHPVVTYEKFEQEFYRISHKIMAQNAIPFPEVRSVLLSLKQNNKKLAIVTNKDRFCVESILKLHNFLDIFECIVCCDDVVNRKPDPEPLELTMIIGNYNKAECLYIGDNENDILFANRASIDVIRIDRYSSNNYSLDCLLR